MTFKSKLVALTGSDADVYELPATYDGAILLYLVNSQNASRDVTVKFRKQSTGVTTTLGVFAVAAQTAWQYPVKFALEEGDKVIASCAVSGVTAYATVIVADLTPISNVFNPRGAWSGAATYAPMDVVSSGRNSYLALSGNTNDLPPSSNWMVLAQGGADGAPGAPGSGAVNPTGTIAANRLAAFNDSTGNVIKDSGKSISDFATAAQGAKVDYLTVTAAINLDTVRTTVAGLGTASTKATGTSAGNVPVLDGSGLLDAAVLPPLAITDSYVVASQAAMLALSAQKGDVAIRSDLNRSFILSTNSPATLADWKELLTPTDAVLSVNGKTGVAVLNPDDLSDASSTNKFASATSVAAITHAATSKATPVDADEIPLSDSAASFGLKKLTWANLKAALKATAAQLWAGTSTLFLTPEQLWAAGVPTALTLKANATVTITSASPGVVTDTAHGFTGNEPIHLTTTGALPSPLVANTEYYVVPASITTNTYQVSATVGGAAINTTTAGSGTHTREARLLLDGNVNSFFTVTANRNFTLAKPRNWKAGQQGRLTVTQDGTGSRTWAYPNVAAGGYGVATGAALVLSTAAGAKDKVWIDAESATDVVLSIGKAIA